MRKMTKRKKSVPVRHPAFRRAVGRMDDALHAARRDFDNTELIEALGKKMFGDEWRSGEKLKAAAAAAPTVPGGPPVREWGT